MTQPRFKYPRTRHVPWSLAITDDDEVHASVDRLFAGKCVVISEKVDGECTSLYRDGMHARSPDSRPHPSQDWVRNLHSRIAHEIPPGWRICGENVYAQHSLHYDALASYFLVFSVWDARNVCLSWDETREWAALLGLETVPVLYEGWWDSRVAHRYDDEHTRRVFEGYVIRLADEFAYEEFERSTAKFVASRPVGDEHWRHRAVVANGLALHGGGAL